MKTLLQRAGLLIIYAFLATVDLFDEDNLWRSEWRKLWRDCPMEWL